MPRDSSYGNCFLPICNITTVYVYLNVTLLGIYRHGYRKIQVLAFFAVSHCSIRRRHPLTVLQMSIVSTSCEKLHMKKILRQSSLTPIHPTLPQLQQIRAAATTPIHHARWRVRVTERKHSKHLWVVHQLLIKPSRGDEAVQMLAVDANVELLLMERGEVEEE